MLRRLGTCAVGWRGLGVAGRRFFGNENSDTYGLLKTLIETYRKSYDLGEPIISDLEYDTMYQNLLDLEHKFPQLVDKSSPSQQVAPIVEDIVEGKKLHSLPMLGLQNTYNDDQLRKFQSRIEREIASRKTSHIPLEYITEMKYDGMAISLIFKNGELCYGTSRGDGLYGEDLTANFIAYVNNLPFQNDGNRKRLRVPIRDSVVEIRGEIVCSSKEFERVNKLKEEGNQKTFSTPRNLATGSFSKISQEEREFDISLDMICYSLHIYKENILSDGSIDMDQLETSVVFAPEQPTTNGMSFFVKIMEISNLSKS